MPQILFFLVFSERKKENNPGKLLGQGNAEGWCLLMLRAAREPAPPPRRGKGEGEVWMFLSEGAFLTVPKIKGLTFSQWKSNWILN